MGSIRPVVTNSKQVKQTSIDKNEVVVTNRSKRARVLNFKREVKNKSASRVNKIIALILIAVSVFSYIVIRSNTFYYADAEKVSTGSDNYLRVSLETIVSEVEAENSETSTPDTNTEESNPAPQPPGTEHVIQYGSGAGTGDGKMVKIVNDWLTLYDNATVAGSYYSIDVTTVADYEANKWSMGEGQNYAGNQYAKAAYDDQTLNRPNGATNGYVDGSNRYWVAVGPCVTNKNFNATTDNASAGTVGYGKFFDIVLKENSTGDTYYVPLKSGDCKVHTHPTGIVQTGAHIPDGAVSPGHNDHSIVEWVGVAPSVGTAVANDYTLVEIRVYE